MKGAHGLDYLFKIVVDEKEINSFVSSGIGENYK